MDGASCLTQGSRDSDDGGVVLCESTHDARTLRTVGRGRVKQPSLSLASGCERVGRRR